MGLGSNQSGPLSEPLQARTLLAVLTDLVRELRGPSSSLLNISLSSRLDRDLGIDSLGRTELVMRIERAFRVRLPISVMAEANTVGDLLRALQKATSESGPLEAHAVAEIPEAETLAVAGGKGGALTAISAATAGTPINAAKATMPIKGNLLMPRPAMEEPS